MTVEVEDDFDIKDYIIPMAEEDIHEQQKDRTYRHSVTKNYGFVDNLDSVIKDGVLNDNRNKREYVACVIEYLKNIDINKENANKTIGSWIPQEIDRLNKEFGRLSVLAMSDSDIIQTALIELGNQYLAKYDTETSNKITDVRNRYLEMIYPKEKSEE
jgi:hypothetical protein